MNGAWYLWTRFTFIFETYQLICTFLLENTRSIIMKFHT